VALLAGVSQDLVESRVWWRGSLGSLDSGVFSSLGAVSREGRING